MGGGDSGLLRRAGAAVDVRLAANYRPRSGVQLCLLRLVRKKIAVEAQTGMLFETLWLLPVAAIYLFGIADSPTSHMGSNPWSLNLMLMAAGVVTTIPLLCFTGAATRLRLSTLGFFQYIGPTLMFLLAVVFYGEVPGADKMVTFAFIWVALAIFVADAIYTQRRGRKGL